METKSNKRTPWGVADHERKLAEGIVLYSTPSHGGIWLSEERRKALGYSKNFLNSSTWWEEDCDWAVPYVFFAEDIRKTEGDYFEKGIAAAWKTLETWHPEFYARMKGEGK